MLDFYYIMTKDIGVGPHLIGKLERVSKEDYQFYYMIKKDKFPNIMVHIPDMDILDKIYNTQETWHGIMRRVVPSKDSWACKYIEEDHNLKHEDYNQWDFLNRLYEVHNALMKRNNKREPFHDPYERVYFYKELPRRLFRYDL